MKKIIFALTALLMSGAMFAKSDADTLVWRIKSMRCEDCAHNVSNALRKDAGVKGLTFDLEKRTVTVAYDAAATCPDSIMQKLRGTRYRPSEYNPQDTIMRGMGLKVDDMHCQNCANRIMKRFTGMVGIDSIATHVDKHYVFFRYDANRTTKATIREVLGSMGFTPVTYYTSKDISFAYFNIPEKDVNEKTVDTALALDGVDDANVNVKQKSLAITYVNTETDVERIQTALKEEGIMAVVPKPHECKEK